MHFIKKISLSLVLIFGIFGTTLVSAGNGIANLPNTAACRAYLNYAQRGYGGNNIPELYRLKNRCFNGSRNVPIIKKEFKFCSDGYSRSKYAGRWYCGSKRPIACHAGYVASRALNGLWICPPGNIQRRVITKTRYRKRVTRKKSFADSVFNDD